MLNPLMLDELVRRALAEDLGSGDLTTLSVVPETKKMQAHLVAKAEGMICGHPVAQAVFAALDPQIVYTPLVEEGEDAAPGQPIAKIEGSARAILSGAQVALNFIGHLSGIATQTHKLAEAIKYYKARLIDSRATTPGLRALEKYAVRVGGGINHRFGLFDGIVVNVNHITIAGGIKPAVTAVRRLNSHLQRVGVQVSNLEQVEEALEAGAEVLLFEGCDPAVLRQVVEKVAGRALVEAYGPITAENLVEVAKAGVDFISMGSPTISVKAVEFSLDLVQVS